MAVIFINSSFSGNESAGFSEAIIGFLVSVSRLLGEGKTAVSIREMLSSDGFHLLLRKSAHFMEFGILGILVSGSLGCSTARCAKPAGDKKHPAKDNDERLENEAGPVVKDGRTTGDRCGFKAFLQGVPGKTLFSTLLCAMYAVTDEIHQLYVPGRACSPWDVLIDTAGAFVLGGAFLLVCSRRGGNKTI